MFRNNDMGHREAEQLDELSRIDDETHALFAEIDREEQADREAEAKEVAGEAKFFRKIRIFEIVVGVVLLVAWLYFK